MKKAAKTSFSTLGEPSFNRGFYRPGKGKLINLACKYSSETALLHQHNTCMKERVELPVSRVMTFPCLSSPGIYVMEQLISTELDNHQG
jgi:hypothetical protein